mgnify:CR=1 FL=1
MKNFKNLVNDLNELTVKMLAFISQQLLITSILITILVKLINYEDNKIYDYELLINNLPKETRQEARSVIKKVLSGNINPKKLLDYSKESEEHFKNAENLIKLARENIYTNPEKGLDLIINAKGEIEQIERIGLFNVKDLKEDLLRVRNDLQEHKKKKYY